MWLVQEQDGGAERQSPSSTPLTAFGTRLARDSGWPSYSAFLLGYCLHVTTVLSNMPLRAGDASAAWVFDFAT